MMAELLQKIGQAGAFMLWTRPMFDGVMWEASVMRNGAQFRGWDRCPARAVSNLLEAICSDAPRPAS